MPKIIATVQTIITIQTDDETVELVTNSVDSRINVLLYEQYSLYYCTLSLLHQVKLLSKFILLNFI
jgi:hypothetical protein